MADYAPIVIAVIGGVFGILSLIIQARRDRYKINADATTTYEALTARQVQRISMQDAKIANLETEIDELNVNLRKSFAEIEALRSGVELLVNQLKANGHSPVWTPKTVPLRSPAERTRYDDSPHA